MPIMEVRHGNRLIGYKYGVSGKLYTIITYGKAGAWKKARNQGIAIRMSGGR